MSTDNPYSAMQAQRDLVTLINIFTVAPGGQQPFADAQTGEYRRLRGKVAGSFSANLHRGLDGVTLANFAQFGSMEHYRGWVESELMREHMLVIRDLILRSEPGMYRVAHVADHRGSGASFVEVTEGGGPLALIVRLRPDAGADRAGVLFQAVEAAPVLVREVPGVVSVTILDGQPIGLAPPPAAGAPRGVVGDERVAFQSPLVTAYVQLEDEETARRLAEHDLYRKHLTAKARGVHEAFAHLFEVVFVQNDDPGKPAR